jgi:hypothetical protein
MRAGIRQFWHRARLEARDAVELVLVPGLAALLPWRWCFWLFRRVARVRWLYREPCERALAQAQARGVVHDPKAWLWRRRLVTLIDHADFYLARFRSDRWLQRYVDVSGEWPAAGQSGMLCSFHWGAGMWGLRHAAQAGLRAHALVAPLNQAAYQGRWILGWYARARTHEVERALRRPVMEVSRSLRPVLRALGAGVQVLAVVDVPADQVAASEPIELLGLRARVPRGLLRLAVDQGVPVTVYITGFDAATGRRFLRIIPVGISKDVPELIRKTFAPLEAALQEDAAAWHFWGIAERFFID